MRSETSSITAMTPSVRLPSSMTWVRTVQRAPWWPVEVEHPGRRSLLPRLGQKLGHRLRRQSVPVPASHQGVCSGVTEDVLAVLVADDHALGKRVESAPQPDGVGRGLFHRFRGAWRSPARCG